MHANALCGQLKRSKLCSGVIQILYIPEGDDFRLFQAINFLHIKNVHGYLTKKKFQKNKFWC